MPAVTIPRRVVDFHGLRHTFITSLANGGVHPKTAQILARHSDINMTMSRYTHSLRGAEAAALSSLPDYTLPEAATLKRTGTDDVPTDGGGEARKLAGNAAAENEGGKMWGKSGRRGG